MQKYVCKYKRMYVSSYVIWIRNACSVRFWIINFKWHKKWHCMANNPHTYTHTYIRRTFVVCSVNVSNGWQSGHLSCFCLLEKPWHIISLKSKCLNMHEAHTHTLTHHRRYTSASDMSWYLAAVSLRHMALIHLELEHW